jgi:plastocyanin
VRRARRFAVAAAVTAAASVLPVTAHAATADVTIPGTFFSPATVRVLAGDQVHWMNHDSRPHTATADGGAFDTGSIAAHGEASVAFPTLGTFAYTCRIHPFMHGTVAVVALVLAGPASPPAKGGTARLTGRAATGIASVTLERAVGTGFTVVASAAPGVDGAFAFSVKVDAPATFRVHAGTALSDPVTVRPVELKVRISATRRGRRTYAVRARIAPAARGTLVAFQRYVPERFAWRTIARRRTDRTGLVRLSVRATHRTRVRAVVRAGGLLIASPSVRIGRRPPFG